MRRHTRMRSMLLDVRKYARRTHILSETIQRSYYTKLLMSQDMQKKNRGSIVSLRIWYRLRSSVFARQAKVNHYLRKFIFTSCRENANNFGCVLIKIKILLIFSISIFFTFIDSKSILFRYGLTLYRKMRSYFAVNEQFPTLKLKRETFSRIIN